MKEPRPNKLMKAIDDAGRAMAGISNNTLAAGTLGSVPVIGQYITSWLSSQRIKVLEERLYGFKEQLEETMKEIDESKIDFDYLNSEAFFDLLQKVINVACQTRSREKIFSFARILANSCRGNNIGGHNPELYVNIIDGFTDPEFRVCLAIYEQQKSDCPIESGDGAEPRRKKLEDEQGAELARKSGVPQDDLDFILRRLEGLGFVIPFRRRGMIARATEPFEITPHIKRMFDFIASKATQCGNNNSEAKI